VSSGESSESGLTHHADIVAIEQYLGQLLRGFTGITSRSSASAPHGKSVDPRFSHIGKHHVYEIVSIVLCMYIYELRYVYLLT
jgi:hypothetical protein